MIGGVTGAAAVRAAWSVRSRLRGCVATLRYSGTSVNLTASLHLLCHVRHPGYRQGDRLHQRPSKQLASHQDLAHGVEQTRFMILRVQSYGYDVS